MNLRRVLFAIFLSIIACQSTVLAESFLLMPEPLDGFIVSKAPIGNAEKPQGYLITVEKEGVIDKVQILVELRDLKDPKARVAAAKGYVNGFSQSIVKSGLKVAESKIPELSPKAVAKKVTADVSFTQPDGSSILTRHVIFFTKYGYDARIIATSKESLDSLTEWVNLIQPIGMQK